MKKTFSILMLCLIAGAGMTSCSNEVEGSTAVIKNANWEFDSLGQSVQTYNLNTLPCASTFQNDSTLSLNEAINSPKKIRKGWKIFLKVLGVFSADALGALFSPAGAGCASIGAAGLLAGMKLTGPDLSGQPMKMKPLMSTSLIKSNSTTCAPLQLSAKIDDQTIVINDGVLHNSTIADIYSVYGNDMFSVPLDTLLCKFNCEAEAYGMSNSESDTANQMVDVISQICETASNLDDFFAQMTKAYPEMTGELAVLKEVMRGYDILDIENDNSEYAQALADIVSKSNISAESKKKLLGAIAVANASVRLWNIEAFE